MTENTKITPNLAYDFLHRMRNDYGQEDRFEEACEDDPTIANREQIALEALAQSRQTADDFYEDKPEEMKAMPVAKPIKQATPLPSIVTKGYMDAPKGRINWAHFENMLKLYTLGFLYQDTLLTPEQKKDKEDLTYAIEQVENLKHPKNPLSAEEIVQKTSTTYFAFGKQFIEGKANNNQELLGELRAEMASTSNEHHFNKMQNTIGIADRVFDLIKNKRYQR